MRRIGMLVLLLAGCVDDPAVKNPAGDANVLADGGSADVAVDAVRPDMAGAGHDARAPDQAVEDLGRPADAALDGPRATDVLVVDGELPDGPAPDASPGDGPLSDAPEADGPAPDAAADEGVDPPDEGLEADAEPDAAVDPGPDMAVVVCPGGRMPAPESCNGVDDDCDMRVDEDFGIGMACDGVGRCGVGFFECDGMGTSRCSTDPEGSTSQVRAERCNGEDDDCDGSTDEGDLDEVCYSGPVGTLDVGECRSGVRRCLEGRLQDCLEDVVPREDVCNGFDDDCDERFDEAYVPVGGCGVGACRNGVVPSSCDGGEVIPCQPGPPTGDDTDCDGIDDDCDGSVDEGYVRDDSCQQEGCGAAAIPSRCVEGIEFACVPGQPSPDDRTCDGRDDDCDMRVDEDYQVVDVCGMGRCREVSVPSSCVNGVETPCAPGAADANDATCDDVDGDCDGIADEDYVADAECGLGVCGLNPQPSRCRDGVEFPCVPGLPLGEDSTCDAVDQDCDGRVDEGFVVQFCGVGVCLDEAVPSSCVAGVSTACMPGAAAPDDANCDDRDDDCDGVADEDVVVLVGGEQRITDDPASSVRPHLVAANGVPTVVWADGRPGEPAIYLRRIDGVGDAVRVSSLGGGHFSPRVAWSGLGYGVAWHSVRDGFPQVYFRLVSADGQPGAVEIRPSDSIFDAANVDLVHDGQGFALAWSDRRLGESEIFFRRISNAGAPVGEPVRATLAAGSASVPSLAALGPGSGYGVAYNDEAGGLFNVWFQLLDANGAPVGEPRRVSTGGDNANAPRLVRAVNGFVVVWYDTRDGNTEIYAAALDENGDRQGENIRVTDDAHPSVLPQIAAGPLDFGVTWQDRRAGNHEIWFQHLDFLGRPTGSPVRISDDPANSFGPSIAWDGNRFGIAWYDERDGDEPEIYFGTGPLGCP